MSTIFFYPSDPWQFKIVEKRAFNQSLSVYGWLSPTRFYNMYIRNWDVTRMDTPKSEIGWETVTHALQCPKKSRASGNIVNTEGQFNG